MKRILMKNEQKEIDVLKIELEKFKKQKIEDDKIKKNYESK